MRIRLLLIVPAAFLLLTWMLTVRSGGAIGKLHADETPKTDRPIPTEETNCVKCHLKAGRELTDAVHVFAGSVHDFNGLSCNDCHGGNTEDDAKAHEVAFGFIGTKLSAHLKACSSCHEDQAAEFAKSPHFWDQQKQLNTKFPLCIDCHGNHDVGNPPADFSMALVCQDCHDDYKDRFKDYASIVETNDKLWESIRGWKSKHPGTLRVPEELEEELSQLRSQTASMIHLSSKIDAEAAKKLNEKVENFREKLNGAAAKPASP
ncbi:MAG: ammonia-forming cytochrome c nitrite reductase subunit c552 [Planctomycetota bacterium]